MASDLLQSGTSTGCRSRDREQTGVDYLLPRQFEARMMCAYSIKGKEDILVIADNRREDESPLKLYGYS